MVQPLTEVQLEVDSRQLRVEAAVSEKLPVAAIIGDDVPQLMNLLEDRVEVKNEAGSRPATQENRKTHKIKKRQ